MLKVCNPLESDVVSELEHPANIKHIIKVKIIPKRIFVLADNIFIFIPPIS